MRRFPRRLVVLFACASPLCAKTDLSPGPTQSARAEQTKPGNELPDAPSAVANDQAESQAQQGGKPADQQTSPESEKVHPATRPTLPDAPSASHPGSASVSGTVLDTSGAAISIAEVNLMESDSPVRSTATGTDGSFTFSDLPPGSYAIVATARGFQQSAYEQFTLTPHQTYHLADIVLPIARVSTAVVVRPTEVIADQQIKPRKSSACSA